MSRIVHFEIPVEDPEKSMAFYTQAFGWAFQKFGEDNYWLITTGEDSVPGINGGMMKKNPGQPPTNIVGVNDIDAAIEKVKAAGGTIVVEKFPIGEIGFVAYFTDPDGIITGLHQSLV